MHIKTPSFLCPPSVRYALKERNISAAEYKGGRGGVVSGLVRKRRTNAEKVWALRLLRAVRAESGEKGAEEKETRVFIPLFEETRDAQRPPAAASPSVVPDPNDPAHASFFRLLRACSFICEKNDITRVHRRFRDALSCTLFRECATNSAITTTKQLSVYDVADNDAIILKRAAFPDVRGEKMMMR